MGEPTEAARGLTWYVGMDADLNLRMARGVDAIEAEFAEYGTDKDKECL